MSNSMTTQGITQMDADDRVGQFGHYAHIGRRCGRCGDLLGHFHFAKAAEIELWGCARCNTGTVIDETNGLHEGHAADRYVSLMKA